MGVGLVGQRMNKGEVVHDSSEVRNHVGDHHATLTARPEFVLRTRQVSGRPLKCHRRTAFQRLTVALD